MDGKTLRAGFTGTQRMSRKSRSTFSLPTCSNSLILTCVLIDRIIPRDRETV